MMTLTLTLTLTMDCFILHFERTAQLRRFLCKPACVLIHSSFDFEHYVQFSIVIGTLERRVYLCRFFNFKEIGLERFQSNSLETERKDIVNHASFLAANESMSKYTVYYPKRRAPDTIGLPWYITE